MSTPSELGVDAVNPSASLETTATQSAAVATVAFAAVVVLNVLAWKVRSGLLTMGLYQVILALGVCIVFPTAYYRFVLRKPLSVMGLSLHHWRRDVVVGLAFVVATVPWRIGVLPRPSLHDLTTLTAAMVFSTLFEEVFFRGFIQTTYEAAFGTIPAIIVSGFFFSLYHVGYGEPYRAAAAIAKLTLVGVMFAVAFRTTRSVLTSYALNLPHAIVTFVAQGEFFDARVAVLSLAVVVAALIWLFSISRYGPGAVQPPPYAKTPQPIGGLESG